MSAFQGALAGIGSTGEQMATGEQAAQEFALKSALAKSTIAAQTARSGVEQGQLELAKSGQQQAYTLAQQQHELYRQSLIDQGWKDNGVTIVGQDSATGMSKYQRNFVNMRDGSTRAIPVQGVPPDSQEGVMNFYRTLTGLKDDKGNPQFNNIEAAQIAFRTPQLYRQGPAEQYKGFQQIGQDQFPDDPKKAAAFGKNLWDEFVGKAGYFHYGPGASSLTGGGRDMTGMTAGEQRLYKSTVGPIEMQEKFIMMSASKESSMAVNAEQQQAVWQKYQPQIQMLEDQANSARMQIIGSRAGKLVSPGLLSTVGAKPQAGPAAGPAAASSFTPTGAPPAKGLPDGAKWYDGQGNLAATVKSGAWVALGH